MVSPFAHMLGTLCSSICWHLASLLNDWDEVKGQSPLVYEEVFFETSGVDVKLFTIITFRLNWFSVAEQPIVLMINGQNAHVSHTAECFQPAVA